MPIFSGKFARVVINGVSYPMTRADMTIRGENVDITNFLSDDGWRDRIQGLKDVRIECEGPYNTDLPIPFSGTAITIVFTVGTAFNLSFTCIVNEARPSQDINRNSTIRITAESTGRPAFA